MISKQALRELRNRVPIDAMFSELDIPTKRSDGQLRFLCPLCREFNTATNHATNLARCFRCRLNFNPIDLVMVATGSNFLQAVGWVTPLLES